MRRMKRGAKGGKGDGAGIGHRVPRQVFKGRGGRRGHRK
jgi:hypothetical protein